MKEELSRHIVDRLPEDYDQPEPEPRKRERMGRVSSWERWALTLGPGLLGSFAAVVIVTTAIWSRHV